MPHRKTGLTEFLLADMRKRPGMFLVEPKLSNLALFLTGYYFAADDPYFDVNDGFISWFHKKKRIELGPYWQTPFLEKANGNDREALDIYFNYLEQYRAEKRG